MRFSISDLAVNIGARTVLSGVTTTFDSAELVAIIGPNGAGKTTFLRALAGLVASNGVLKIDDQDWRAMAAPAT